MPCTYEETEWDVIRRDNREMTQLLCEILGKIEQDGGMSQMSAEVQRWWADHKIKDEKRRERERTAKEQRKADLEKRLSALQREYDNLREGE